MFPTEISLRVEWVHGVHLASVRLTHPRQNMNIKQYLKFRSNAFRLVEKSSDGEMRYFSPIENQPYWTHLMNVHNFLVINGEKDYEILVASILHDILEDTQISSDYLSKYFTERISKIVGLVSKYNGIDEKTFYENILKSDDLGPSKIKVADRIDNILTNYCYSGGKVNIREKIIETRQYFIPMARRAGWLNPLREAIRFLEKNNQ